MTPQSELHLQAGLFAAKLLAVKITPDLIRLWAYHMKMMLKS